MWLPILLLTAGLSSLTKTSAFMPMRHVYISTAAAQQGTTIKIFNAKTIPKKTTPTTWALLASSADRELVGEEAAKFSLEEQSLKSWVTFGAAVATVLSVLFYAWIYEGGPGLGNSFKETIESIAGGDTVLSTIYMNGFFAIAHSGLASLRPSAERALGSAFGEAFGTRAWRVIFAMVSLPLAFSCIVYFINHRYDGEILWDLRSVPAMHTFVWLTSFLSFFFLYPSTFNLLEVAAVDKPQLHLWETGIIRITRHPQMVGQLMWCAAHTAYMGSVYFCSNTINACAYFKSPREQDNIHMCNLNDAVSSPYLCCLEWR